MMTTYVCMTAGDMDAESSANGLMLNISLALLAVPAGILRAGFRAFAFNFAMCR
jgi:hypothetical protein